MAKKAKSGLNVSQLIRDFMKENPKAKPQEVANTLNQQHGLSIKAGFVSTIKSNDKRKNRKNKRAAKTAAATTSAGPVGVSREALLAAKKFIDSIGGLKKAKAAVDLLAELS